MRQELENHIFAQEQGGCEGQEPISTSQARKQGKESLPLTLPTQSLMHYPFNYCVDPITASILWVLNVFPRSGWQPRGSEWGQQQPPLNRLCPATSRKPEKPAVPPGTTGSPPHIFLRDGESSMTARTVQDRGCTWLGSRKLRSWRQICLMHQNFLYLIKTKAMARENQRIFF